MGQRTKIDPDARKSKPREPVVVGDQSGAGSEGGCQAETIEVQFVLVDGVDVHAGDRVAAHAGTPLVLISAGREIGSFENARVAAGLRAGFSYSGAVTSVSVARGRGVAQLQAS